VQAGATVRIQSRPGTARRGPFTVVWSEDRTVAQLVPIPLPSDPPATGGETGERSFRVIEVSRR